MAYGHRPALQASPSGQNHPFHRFPSIPRFLDSFLFNHGGYWRAASKPQGEKAAKAQ